MEKEILEILKEICPGVDFEKEQALVDDEILESLDVVSIVSELMYKYNIELDVEDLLPEHFNSLKQITELVESKL